MNTYLSVEEEYKLGDSPFEKKKKFFNSNDQIINANDAFLNTKIESSFDDP
jgi:hypothetical protein